MFAKIITEENYHNVHIILASLRPSLLLLIPGIAFKAILSFPPPLLQL